MRMDAIGYNHKHRRPFCVDRPNGETDWLMLVVKTPAYFRVGEKNIRTPGNAVIIYTPGEPQYYYADSEEYFDDWIHFGPDADEEALISELGIPLNKPVTVANISEISSIARNMCHEQYSENKFRTQVLDLCFRTLLYKIAENSVADGESAKASEGIYADQLRWIRNSIYRWPSRNYSIDDMAAEVGISRSRFQHIYSETFGISVNRDVMKSRMTRAAELLKTTDLPVKDVGILVGYGNTSYFVKLFGTSYGMSPLQYRSSENQKK